VIDPNERDYTGMTEEQIKKSKHKQKLLEDAANREYKNMTKNFRQDEQAIDRIQTGRELQRFSDSSKMALNLVVSAATMFAVGYWTCRQAFGSEWPAAPFLGGIAGSIFIIVVETILLVIRTNDVDSVGEKRIEEKKKTFSLTVDKPSSKRVVKVEENIYVNSDTKSKKEN